MKHFLLLTTAGVLSICGMFTVSSESAMAQQPNAPQAQQGKGAESAAPGLSSDKQKVAYGIGFRMGNDLRTNQLSAEDVDIQALARGVSDAINKKKPAVGEDDLRKAMMNFQQSLQERMKVVGDKNKKDGEAFLAANKNKDGVKTTPSGLQYKVIKSGNGATPGPTDNVKANYKGTLLDGTVFDSSSDQGGPVEFPVNHVIKGWTEALQLMKVGDKWQLFIPSNLAYGEAGNGPIGPNAALVFELELVDVSKGETLPGMMLPGGK